MRVRLVLQNVFLLFLVCSLPDIMHCVASLSLFLLRNSSLSNQFLVILLNAGSMIEVFFIAAVISVRVILFDWISIP